MSSLTSSAATPLAIAGPAPVSALEFKSFAFPPTGALSASLPVAPGAVERDGEAAVLLHFAPGRFLVPLPSDARLRDLRAFAAAGVGALFDVTGKYQHLRITGPRAARVLAEGIDIGAVLEGRDCAFVTLFDCPVVVARHGMGYDAWVDASYAVDFRAMLDRIAARLES